MATEQDQRPGRAEDADDRDDDVVDAELIEDEDLDTEDGRADLETESAQPELIHTEETESGRAEDLETASGEAEYLDAERSRAEDLDTEPPPAELVDTEEGRAEDFDTEEGRAEDLDTEPAPSDLVDTEEGRADDFDTEPDQSEVVEADLEVEPPIEESESGPVEESGTERFEPDVQTAGTAPAATAVGSQAEPAEPAPSTVLFDPEAPLLAEATAYQERWNAIQTGFVDDPQATVANAGRLVSEVLGDLARTFESARNELEGQWQRDGGTSTEDLRVAFQSFRAVFNRLVSA